MLFLDRFDAGRVLAAKAWNFANRTDTVVLALPRGGVPVGFEVAEALNAPLDVFVVCKLGVPGYAKLAMGAIASGGVRVLNKNVVQNLGIPDEVINRVAAKEVRELERREREYRDGQPPVEVQGRTVILVDDGLATGSSMRVAVRAPKRKRPAQIVVAVPVGDPAACAELEPEVDQVICAVMPKAFRSVSQWYDDFAQTTDEVVRDLLSRTASLRTPTAV